MSNFDDKLAIIRAMRDGVMEFLPADMKPGTYIDAHGVYSTSLDICITADNGERYFYTVSTTPGVRITDDAEAEIRANNYGLV